MRNVGSRAVARLGLLVIGLAACGGPAGNDDSSNAPNVISAGQVDIQLPAGWKVTDSGVERPPRAQPGGSGAPVSSGSDSEDTIPLAEEDPQTKFFEALSSFSSCLQEAGVKFIGAPDPANPNSPANDPNYIQNLATCAARSNIVQALEEQQAAQDNLTPEEIEQQNKGYLAWRDCMIGRGWGIPEPKPDSKGRLFSFGAQGGTPQFDPPAGEDILSSDDVRECATESQQQTSADG